METFQGLYVMEYEIYCVYHRPEEVFPVRRLPPCWPPLLVKAVLPGSLHLGQPRPNKLAYSYLSQPGTPRFALSGRLPGTGGWRLASSPRRFGRARRGRGSGSGSEGRGSGVGRNLEGRQVGSYSGAQRIAFLPTRGSAFLPVPRTARPGGERQMPAQSSSTSSKGGSERERERARVGGVSGVL